MNYPPIFETCAADVAVVALLGESGGVLRMYPAGAAPQGVTKPYAVWQSISGGPENYLAGRPDVDRFGLQVDAYADTLTAARALADALEAALETVAHVTSFRGEEKDVESALYRVGFDVEWFVNRAVPTPTPVSSSSEPAPPVSSDPFLPACPLYPLDDDGTLATAFGYGYAGPAVGPDAQGMDYTAASTTGLLAILAPAGSLTTARALRPASSFMVVESEVTVATGEGSGYLLVVVTDAGGALINSASLSAETGETGVEAITVSSSGAIAGYIDQLPKSLLWFYPAGQKTVGPSDRVSFALGVGSQAQAGDRVVATLLTQAADLVGNWAGGFTLCGEPI